MSDGGGPDRDMNGRLRALLVVSRRALSAASSDECTQLFCDALHADLGCTTHRVFSGEDAVILGDELLRAATQCRQACEVTAWRAHGGASSVLFVPLRLQKSPPDLAMFERSEPFTDDDQTVAALTAQLLESALRCHTANHALRESQARLNQSERMKSIGQLAGGVAHDFNNMLMVMSAAAEVMSDTLPADHPCTSHLHLILDTSHRAAELTQKLLAFSRKGRPAMKPVDVHEVLSSVREFLVHSLDRRITLSLSLAAGTCLVEADSTQLQNALLNVCLNSRDAMPGGGLLKISTQRIDLDAEASAAELGSARPGSYVRIEVRDTGTGMDEQTLTQAFDPFFTTKDPGRGTGLGLSVVFGAIREHGGTVTLDSKPGKGTTCTILLPLIDRGRPEAGAVPPNVQAAGSLRILLLDDEPGVCHTAAQLMRQLGHNVQALRSGEKALNHLRTHWSGYDLLVLDVVMPHPTGVEVHCALAEEGISLPTVFVSGYSEQHLLEGIQEGKGIVFLQKPFRQSELARAIARCMETSGARPVAPMPATDAWQ